MFQCECDKTTRKKISRICATLKKDENKREGRMGTKPCDGKRKMRQKKTGVKEKTRLTSKTRCAQTIVTVYLVHARGVVATWL